MPFFDNTHMRDCYSISVNKYKNKKSNTNSGGMEGANWNIGNSNVKYENVVNGIKKTLQSTEEAQLLWQKY